MRDAGAGGRQPVDRGVVEVDRMCQPHVAGQPAERVQVLDRRATEPLRAELALVGRLRDVGMQPHSMVPRETRGRPHQLSGHGERRARGDPHPQHRAWLRVMERRDGPLGRGEDAVNVLGDLIGRQAARRGAQVHRAAGRVKPQANVARRGDGCTEHVACSAREHVVVVGRGRAARPGQPGQRRRCRVQHDLLVDPRPDRVKLGQPLEQGRVHGPATRGPLIQVMVSVDQPRRRHAAGRIDDPPVGEIVRDLASGDGGDPVAVNGDVAAGILGPPGVHGHDMAAAKHRRGHAPEPRSRAAASRTESRIFS